MAENSRRKFTHEEDQALRRLVGIHGLNQWDTIAKLMPQRTARQCHERYAYYLAPSVYARPWTADDDRILAEKIAECGSRWIALTRFFPGRDSNQLKNRWYKVIARRRKAAEADITEQLEKEDEEPELWDEFFIFDPFE